jgi:uncharacterized protein YndB with AHSA1/START domain
MTERRSITHEAEVPGTPEDVWEAIATGPGISAWFVPTEVDGRPGGEAVFHLGGDGQDARTTVTGWEPPARFALEEPWPAGEGVTLATEFLVEARAGGTCVVRVVSTFSADGFDDELGTIGAGWTAFLDTLRTYLTHFRGRPSAALSVTGDSPAATDEAWAELTSALGVEHVTAGETVASDVAPLAGTVERVGHEELLVRSDDALVSVSVFSWGDRTVTAVRETRFGPDAEADAERDRAAWTAWMERVSSAAP